MRRRYFFVAFAVVALLLAGVVSLFASGSPDGLERVAEDQGIAHTAKDHALADGPMADYGVSAIDNAPLSGGLAGVVGVLVVLALTTGVACVVRRRRVDTRGS
ncbi:MAG: PDGLE domain-containing protein [Nocardioidaceae bacterium]